MNIKSTSTLLGAALGLALLSASAHAEVVYTEDFNFADGNDHTYSEVNWTGVGDDGSDYTSHAGILAATDVEGSHRNWLDAFQPSVWFVSDAPALSSIHQVRFLDRQAGVNYRIGLEVGGTWYLTGQLSTSTGGGFDPGDGAHPGITVADFTSGFAEWGSGDATTGAPADNTEAWDLTTLGT